MARRRVAGSPRASLTGVVVTSWFCGDCGPRLYGERKGRPDSMNLRAYLLAGADRAMFIRSAQAWVQPATVAEMS